MPSYHYLVLVKVDAVVVHALLELGEGEGVAAVVIHDLKRAPEAHDASCPASQTLLSQVFDGVTGLTRGVP